MGSAGGALVDAPQRLEAMVSASNLRKWAVTPQRGDSDEC